MKSDLVRQAFDQTGRQTNGKKMVGRKTDKRDHRWAKTDRQAELVEDM